MPLLPPAVGYSIHIPFSSHHTLLSTFPNPNNFIKPKFINQICSLKPLQIKLPTSYNDNVVRESFLETIGELEKMMRDPSDALAQMKHRLYCALEAFDWLQRENRVDGETMELMVTIVCGWIERVIGEDHYVDDIVDLLKEMDCVGLEFGFNVVEKVVALYWERGKKEEAVMFVKGLMRREGARDGGGAVGYVAGKMMVRF